MAHNPREIGRQIGSIIADAKRQAHEKVIQAPIEPSRVVVEAPSVSVEAPVVNVATDMIAKAIEESRFDAGDLVTVISEAAKTIAAVDLSGLRESIEYTDNKKNIDGLAKSVEAQTDALSKSHHANVETLAGAILTLGKTQAEHIKAIIAAINAQGKQIANMQAMQAELLQAAYADRVLILDGDGNPTGVQIERQIN